jgi:hypothetical protein
VNLGADYWRWLWTSMALALAEIGLCIGAIWDEALLGTAVPTWFAALFALLRAKDIRRRTARRPGYLADRRRA